MRYGSIYIATNKHTGEQYVGQTRQPVQKRWAAHWRTAICSTARKAKFQNALLEFGCDAFGVEEVFVAFDAEALNHAEILMIAELQPSYNTSKGGMGLRPVEVTEATKRKRSEAAKARWANLEWREKTVANIKLAAQTPEATARGKAVASIGIAARWADHIKKPLPLPRVKTCKPKRDPAIGRMLAAQAKWKPVYCPELQCSFQSQKTAAEFFGVLRTSVCNAVKQKGKVAGKFTLEMVA
jgi:group I intron endonuclease